MVNALSITGLKKIYPNGLVALKGIDLDVKEGDFFALLGQNGAGKTTTIGILSSLVNKTEGKVVIFGHDIDVEWEKAKACIGIVPQEINFNPFEKIEDILINQAGYYGIDRKTAKPRAEKYLKKMSLWEKRTQIALKLSGGMKRRLMIARALMNEPRLLILDEPTAGVDIGLRHTLWNFLQEINNAGTTIILTTHYLEEAERLCKHVGIIDEGEILVADEMKTLLYKMPIQTIILELQHSHSFKPDLIPYPLKLIDDKTLEIEIKKDDSLNDLFQCLTNQNIVVSSLRYKRNRLEELFINLVKQRDIIR